MVTAPAQRRAQRRAPNITYTPTAGYSGADNFTFQGE